MLITSVSSGVKFPTQVCSNQLCIFLLKFIN